MCLVVVTVIDARRKKEKAKIKSILRLGSVIAPKTFLGEAGFKSVMAEEDLEQRVMFLLLELWKFGE